MVKLTGGRGFALGMLALMAVACGDSTSPQADMAVTDDQGTDVVAETSVDVGMDQGADVDTGTTPIEVCDGVDNDGDTDIDEGTSGPVVWAGATGVSSPKFEVGPLVLTGFGARRLFVMNNANTALGERQVVFALEFDAADFINAIPGPGAAYVSHFLRLHETDPNVSSNFTFKAASFTIPFDQFKSLTFLPANFLPGLTNDSFVFLGPDSQTLYILEHDPSSIPSSPDPKAIMNAGIWSQDSLATFFTAAGIPNPGTADVIGFFGGVGNPILMVVAGLNLYALTGSPASSFQIDVNSYFFATLAQPPTPPLNSLFSPDLQLFFASKNDTFYTGLFLPPPPPPDAGVPDAGTGDAGVPALPIDWTPGLPLTNYIECSPPPPPATPDGGVDSGGADAGTDAPVTD